MVFGTDSNSFIVVLIPLVPYRSLSGIAEIWILATWEAVYRV